jgi:hypothetical protein
MGFLSVYLFAGLVVLSLMILLWRRNSAPSLPT